MRRMLTDKLTKSIKEVVNAYNEGEFSAVSANPETTTETLTGIEIDGVGYAVSGGSGSVDIDNKTIIQNLDGELETAVGGYKEVTETTDVNIPRNDNGNEFDLYDAEIAQNIYDNLEINETYPVTLTVSNVSGLSQADIDHCYILSTRDNTGSNKFGGDDCLHIIKTDESDVAIEFYVDMDQDNGRVHVYGGNSGIYPFDSNATLAIDFGNAIDPIEVTIYHKIPKEYLELTEYKAGEGIRINNDTITANLTYYGGNPVREFSNGEQIGYYLNYSNENFKADQVEGIPQLATYIGGGYKSVVQIDSSEFSVISGGDWDGYYSTANTDFIHSLENIISQDLIANRSLNPGDTFEFGMGDPKLVCNDASPNWYVIDGDWSFNVSVDAGGNGDVTCTAYNSGTPKGSLNSFIFNKNTGEITTHATACYLNIALMQTTQRARLEFGERTAIAGIVEKVDNTFLPAFDQVPTVAGTYTLQVTVDASGNPTFTWVTANV